MTDIERPIVGRYVYECGACHPSRDDDATLEASHRRKRDGRPRIVVLDTEKPVTRPRREDGSFPPCFACPHKRASGSKIVRAFPDASVDANGKPVKWRYVGTCYPRWERAT